jgi:two-component system OmpR family sensor kinase
MTEATEPERAIIRRARTRVGVTVGLVITSLIMLVGGIAYTMVVYAQDEQVRREVRYTVAHGEPTTPPGCAWLFAIESQAVTTGAVPAPAGFPLLDDLERVRVSHTAIERTVKRNGTTYLVRTETRADGRTAQAVFDTRYQLADRRHLLLALAVAEFVGLAVAAATALIVGHRAVAPLAEALAKQRRFVTDASHELRTPITHAYTRVQVLVRQAAAADLPADHRSGLDRLAAAIRRLGGTVDDLLLSARLAVSVDRDGQPVDLAAVAASAAAAEADRAAERRLTVTVDRPAEPLLVFGVESALWRAVGELLANAVNHTPDGGRIQLTLGRAAGRLVELTVADTGEGLDPAEAGRIFDRFHRGTGGHERRYGLGLALVREVVTGHRGTVEATGHPGAGATFTIRLPEAPPPPGADRRWRVKGQVR